MALSCKIKYCVRLMRGELTGAQLFARPVERLRRVVFCATSIVREVRCSRLLRCGMLRPLQV